MRCSCCNLTPTDGDFFLSRSGRTGTMKIAKEPEAGAEKDTFSV